MQTRRQQIIAVIVVVVVFAAGGIIYHIYRRGQLGISADVFSTVEAPAILLTNQAGVEGTKGNPAEFDHTTVKPDGTIQLAPTAN